jgi:hypothetical protein
MPRCSALGRRLASTPSAAATVLMRGLAAAFVVAFVLAIVSGKGATVLGVLAVLFLLALHRMHRYSRHYAIELFVQFLALKSAKP